MCDYHDAVICDLAETYHIFDYHQVPPQTLAVLVGGLGVNSRTGQAMAGLKAPFDTVLLADLVDMLGAIINGLSKHPKQLQSIAETLAEGAEVQTSGYATPDELKQARENIVKKITKEE